MLSKRPGPGIPTSEAAESGPDPQQSAAILVQCQNVIIRQAIRVRGIVVVIVKRVAHRIEQRETARRTVPKPVMGVGVQREHLLRGQAARILCVMMEARLSAGCGDELHQAAVGAGPAHAGALFNESMHTQLMLLWIQQDVLEAAGGWIESIQPGPRPHPEGPVMILEQGPYRVIANAGRLRRAVAKARESPTARIKATEPRLARADPELPDAIEVNDVDRFAPACGSLRHTRQDGMELLLTGAAPHRPTTICSDPEPARGIDLYVGNEGIRQPAGMRSLAQVLERVAVKAIQPVLGAEPHESLRVLGYAEDRLLREAVVEPEALEAHGNGGSRLATLPCHDQQQGRQ